MLILLGINLQRVSDMCQHEISRSLNNSRYCIRQTIHKFNELRAIAAKLGARRRSKLTDCQKRAINLQQVHR